MWNITLSLSLTHFRASYSAETQHAKHKLHSCKLYIAPRWKLWSNLSRTACPCRIIRACTSIRSVYLFNDHERPSKTLGGVEWTITSCFDVSGFCVFTDRIVIHVKISFSDTTIVASGMKINEKRRGRISILLCLSYLKGGFSFSRQMVDSTNIITFSNRLFFPNVKPWFHRFLSMFRKRSFSFFIEVSIYVKQAEKNQ